jgi:oligosaccharide repeat unit polymerase
MIESFDQLYVILFQTILIFGVLFLLFRKHIFSVFDPLLFYIVTQAFSIELAILEIKDWWYLGSFLISQLFFIAGFKYFTKTFTKDNNIDDTALSFENSEYKFWTYFAVFGFFFVVIANIYLIYHQGIILFSDDPTTVKVSTFEVGGGLGAVRRINWGLINLVSLVVIFLYVKTRKRLFLGVLLILLLISVSGGSKSSVLVYITILAFLGQFESLSQTIAFKKINTLKIPLLVSGVTLALLIIGSNTAGFRDSVLGLGIRFLYFGDIIFYYYNVDAVTHFQQLGFIDFISYELNPFLGILRITPYLPPLSFEMVQYSFMHNESLDVVTGPNLPYYVKGHLFFGTFGGLIYSFIIGLFIAKLRNLMFSKQVSYSRYLIILFINLSAFSFAQDSAYTLSVLFDTFIFSLVPLFLTLIFMYSPNLKEK